MSDPNELIYWGSTCLYGNGMGAPVEDPERQVLTTFTGVDQPTGLVVPHDASNLLSLEARTFGGPNAASETSRGFRGILRAMRALLVSLSLRSDPVVWIEDNATLRVIGGVAGPILTTAPHGWSTGDVLLIRRSGAGLWSLVTITVVGADTFTAIAVAGSILHAIQPGDQALRVEQYWLGMAYAGMPRVEPAEEDWWSQAIIYRFKGSGKYSYGRTTAAVGS